MMNFITRYFTSLWALITYPARFIWQKIVLIFPERDMTMMDTPHGNVYSYHQTSFWRFAKFCAKACLVIWASWSTYVFVYHRPLLQKRTEQVEDLKEEYARRVNDLAAYTKKYNELAREINIADDDVLADDKTSEKTKDAITKKRLNAWAEMDFLSEKIKEEFDNSSYDPKYETMAEITVAHDIVTAENERLKEENKFFAEMMQTISEADNKIVEVATKLTDENTAELKEHLKKINGTIATLNLSQNKLVIQANRFKGTLIGDTFAPIEMNEDLDQKYHDLAENLTLWHGLDRLNKMLPLGAPVSKARITSAYGKRTHPVTGELNKTHKGIDFAGQIGTELFTVAPGRVISAGDRVGYGKTVEIDHGLGFSTLYAHMSEINVARGDWVHPGTVIGLAGNSGMSTGPHLHYEIKYNGRQFNPTTFVKE